MFPRRPRVFWLVTLAMAAAAGPAGAAILWSDLGATLVHESGPGTDILCGALKRDATAADALYFKFHVDPLSDTRTEDYFAAFQLYEGDTPRLAVGNSLRAWAYSAFNTAEKGDRNTEPGDYDLRSSRPEPPSRPGVFVTYENTRRGIENTIVFKVQYVPGAEARVTVWLNPDLAPGATEAGQPEGRTTRFKAKAVFDQIRLRHGGGGGGWSFSDMAIGTSFDDFVSPKGSGAGEAARAALPLTFRTWQREQGLPQNTVRALAQTPDGYLWVGTDDGVTRFDGMRFKSFGLSEGWSSGRVRVLLADKEGTVWIGTAGGGLSRWEGRQFATMTMQDGLPSDSITALAQDNEKRLWVGTESGLVLCQEGRITSLPAAAQFKGQSVTALLKDRHGVMWVGVAGAGIFRYLEGRFVQWTAESVANLLLDPHCLLEDQAGRIWVGAGDDFLLCRDREQWRRYRMPPYQAHPNISALVEEPDGTVWAGTVNEGLFQFKGGKLTAVNANTGLSDNFIETLLADQEGNLWVGTGAGLNRVRRSNLAVFGENEGLGYGAVQGLAEIVPHLVWAGKPSDGLYRFEGRNFARLAETIWSPRYAEVNSLLVARNGDCWVAGAQGLLRVKDPATAALGEDQSALTGRNVISLAEDREGAIWAGTREGELWRGQNGAWQMQTNLAQSHPITAIVPDPRGTLWIGTEGGGVCQLKGALMTRIGRQAGLLSDRVRTLYLDATNALWIGTAVDGLSRWSEGRLATFTTREGLPDNTISQILEDDSGHLWLGSNRGIACVSKRELDDLAAGKFSKVYPQIYGRAEGMSSEECTGGFCPAGLKTKSGLLWFSTLKGVVVADPRLRNTANSAPAVIVEDALVDGVSERLDLALSGTRTNGSALARSLISRLGGSDSAPDPSAPPAEIKLRPGKHTLEFQYTGLSFLAPERIRFRYRLEGLHPDWRDADTRRTAFYDYLPPGEYRFHVTACNSDGVWNEAGAALDVLVLRHFWQARWFVGLTVVALLAGVAGMARVVEQRKHRTQLQHIEQERALERERARIAQDLHDDLGSSLTRLSLLGDLLQADKESPRLVETHARKITQSASQTVRALEEIVWALRPGSDTLQSLVDYIAHIANELFEGDPARCRLDLPHDLPARPLPPEIRHNIFLVIKEALTNAMKHAGAKEVRLQAKAAGDTLDFVVQDDGRGFLLRAPSVPGKGHGLGNMRRRAEVMGGTLTVETAPGKGTTVRLQVTVPATR